MKMDGLWQYTNIQNITEIIHLQDGSSKEDNQNTGEHNTNKSNQNLPGESHMNQIDKSKRLHTIWVSHKNANNSYPLGTVALYGRPYERDPTFVHNPLVF